MPLLFSIKKVANFVSVSLAGEPLGMSIRARKRYLVLAALLLILLRDAKAHAAVSARNRLERFCDVNPERFLAHDASPSTSGDEGGNAPRSDESFCGCACSVSSAAAGTYTGSMLLP